MRNFKIFALAVITVITYGTIANAEINKMQELATLESKVDSIAKIPCICFDDTIAEEDCYIDFCEAIENEDVKAARKAYKEIVKRANWIIEYNERNRE